MAKNPTFSSTMRIDLTPDGSLDALGAAEPKTAQPETEISRRQPEARRCQLVGSDDFRALLQSVYDASVITDIAGYVISCNERAVQFFKYDARDLAGLHITALISGSDKMLVETIKESLQNDRFILIQAFCARGDGSLFPAEISANLIKISGEDYLCFFIRDITLRKEAEDRLRTVHVAIQNSANGIAITDMNATLLYCNPAMGQLLRVDEGEQLEEADITSFLNDISVSDEIINSISSGRPWSGELEMLRQDDTTIFVQASVAPNTNADAEIVGMVWSLLDISEQKMIQHELQERNSQMEEDLSLAREFQQAFIQADYPVFPKHAPRDESVIEFGHVYLPSGAVGGDFFEIFAVSESRVGIFISDVMGHGVRSALVVATIRGLIEELGPLRNEPASFISQMNRDLTRIIKHHGHVTFSTAFYMVIDLTNGEMTYSCAGHPAPFLLRTKAGVVEALTPGEDEMGPALGIFDLTAYKQSSNKMEPGDTLVLYTDGIFEAENKDTCESYETERVSGTILECGDCPPEEILNTLIQSVHEFCDSNYFDDDVCLIGARLKRFMNVAENDQEQPVEN